MSKLAPINKLLPLYLDIAKIIYYHSNHTREDGAPAHGPWDVESIGRRIEVAPRILEDLKQWIISK